MFRRVHVLPMLCLAAAGCGGSSAPDDNSSTPGPTPAPPSNTAPTISGTPLAAIMAGERYAFTPTASDADGDVLSFSISGAPSWANFDSATGALTGTPADADVGTSPGIMISVTDGSDSASLPPFDLEVLSRPAGAAVVSWDIPTSNADGTALEDLAGFAVHYGQTSARYSEVATIDDPTASSAAIGGLVSGQWYFAVTAFDTSGNHSELSDEVSKAVP